MASKLFIINQKVNVKCYTFSNPLAECNHFENFKKKKKYKINAVFKSNEKKNE